MWLSSWHGLLPLERDIPPEQCPNDSSAVCLQIDDKFYNREAKFHASRLIYR